MVTILIVAVFLGPRLTLFPSGGTKSDFNRSCGVMVVACTIGSTNYVEMYGVIFFSVDISPHLKRKPSDGGGKVLKVQKCKKCGGIFSAK